MSNIRKQTIISSLLVYIGFIVGAVNTYLYSSKSGAFTSEQYGLTQFFISVGQNIFVISNLGLIPVVYKFYPYYKSHLEDRKIDIMTWALGASLIGFIITCIGGVIIKPMIVQGYMEKSYLVVQYYYLLFPFSLGMLLFFLFEAFCWSIHETVIANFLKETALRIITSVFILLYYFKFISFNTFIYLFSAIYLFIFIILIIYLKRINQLHLPFKQSKVTKRFKKLMFKMQAYIFGGTIINTLATTIDAIFIAHFLNLKSVAVFSLAQYVANLVQVPQRSIQTISLGYLSKAWKQKNFSEINRIYSRSCINLLLLSLFIFGNIWLNVKQGIYVLHIKPEFLEGLNVVLILGFARIVDAGTGVNGTIINTSSLWKFDFWSGVILLTIRLPFTWLLIKYYGIIGSAIGELASYTVYNAVRYEFLRRRFKMQPFNIKTLISIVLAITAYFTCFYSFKNLDGWAGIIARFFLFSGIMITGIVYLKLTPDAHQLINSWSKNRNEK
ncbi:MAG: lipopolysaccharide biosynthesis protein [Sphingobacteriia bacterium]|nr:lipopolysaccharide biosynthesis protein [Sphingobacteriia bacterium]